MHTVNAAGVGLALLLVALPPHGAAAQAQEATAQGSQSDWTATILEEDDFWAPHNRDRHYTTTARLTSNPSGILREPNVKDLSLAWCGPTPKMELGLTAQRLCAPGP